MGPRDFTLAPPWDEGAPRNFTFTPLLGEMDNHDLTLTPLQGKMGPEAQNPRSCCALEGADHAG
eukprot:794938-Pyramimonas_sp.AAC.1